MSSKDSEDKTRRKHAIVRAAAICALCDLLEPLAGFVLDAGLSVHEMQSLFRVAAVNGVANRQREVGRRINISGIAASTGISRAEISGILKLLPAERPAVLDRQQQATNRILKIWHDDPKYTNANGQPADLKIFGSGSTFDSLVKRYGRGIPTRAMMDELLRTGAMELLASEKLRVRTLFALDRGMTAQAVKAFGDRARALMSVMLANMRNQDHHQFVSSIEGTITARNSLPLFRREIAGKGSDFLAVIRDRLLSNDSTRREKRMPKGLDRISVTVFYQEKSPSKPKKGQSAQTRRNLRRAPRISP